MNNSFSSLIFLTFFFYKQLLGNDFKFVLGNEVVRACAQDENGKPDILYFCENRVRINWIPMWIHLPGANKAKVVADLKEINAYCHGHLAVVEDKKKRELTRLLLKNNHSIEYRQS